MGHRAPVSGPPNSPPLARSEGARRHTAVSELTDLRQLRMFQCLAKTGSFTETALVMSVTQSAVSHSIKSLENTLGVTLFDRKGRTPILTASGRILLGSVSEVLREMGRVTQQLERAREGELSTLRIGCTDTLAEFVLPELLLEIHREFPEATFCLRIGETQELMPRLNDGTIDILLGIPSHTEASEGTFQHAALFRDRLRLITGPTHPWTQWQGPPDAKALSGERLLLYGGQSTTNKLVSHWAEEAHLNPEDGIEVKSIGALKRLVATGLGIGLVPEWVITENERGHQLFDYPLPLGPIQRDWCVSMRKTHTFSKLEKRFLALLQEATLTLR